MMSDDPCYEQFDSGHANHKRPSQLVDELSGDELSGEQL
jgi:hypothetical protein